MNSAHYFARAIVITFNICPFVCLLISVCNDVCVCFSSQTWFFRLGCLWVGSRLSASLACISQSAATQWPFCGFSLCVLMCKKRCCNVAPHGSIKFFNSDCVTLHLITSTVVLMIRLFALCLARLTGLLESTNLSLPTSSVINQHAYWLKIAVLKISALFFPEISPMDNYWSCLRLLKLPLWMKAVSTHWYLLLLSTEPFLLNRRSKTRGNERGGVLPQLWGQSTQG